MERLKIEQRLKELKPELKDRYHVEKIGIFGSFARGDASEESDVDILVQFSKPIGWDFVELKDYLETSLGRKVDLVTINALKPQLREQILDEVIYQ